LREKVPIEICSPTITAEALMSGRRRRGVDAASLRVGALGLERITAGIHNLDVTHNAGTVRSVARSAARRALATARCWAAA